MNRLAATMLILGAVPGIATADLVPDDNEIEIHKINKEGTGESIGTVTLQDHEYGVLIRPDLEGLSPGLHGFHLHTNPDCGPAEKDGEMTAGAAAGSHFDPDNTGSHKGPFEKGHKGDLPALYVNEEGEATIPELAPRLELGDFDGHALVIHEGGDNYSDDPKLLGGGGARVACGVIESQ